MHTQDQFGRGRRMTALCVGVLGATGALCRAETEYPVLAPRVTYAHSRHAGESRVGSVGIAYPTADGCDVTAALTPVWLTGAGPARGALRFAYVFKGYSSEEFAGPFFTFGRIAIDTVRADGTAGPPIDLHGDGTIDLKRVALTGNEPSGIDSIRLRLARLTPDTDLTVRVELEDRNRAKAFCRFRFAPPNGDPVAVSLPLDTFAGEVDRRAVKLLSLIIEETHAVDHIRNPAQGGFDILGLSLVDAEGTGQSAAALVELADGPFVAALARRDFETLWRLHDPASGACLDRTLFRDLLHWGATGWLLAALPFAAQQGWVSAAEARGRALVILRFIDNDSRWGDAPVGMVGNSRGVVYRFGGVDASGLKGPLSGTRKIDVNRLNAVEASVIDNALLGMGVATCAAAFASDHPDDLQIRARATRVLGRTRWQELVDPSSGQLYMAWKPERDDAGGYRTPAAFGGFWASRAGEGNPPLTIDWWTAEGAMAALLAVGSETHPVPAGVWYSMVRQVRDGVVLTWPGAWFTYAFLSSTYLDPGLGPDRGSEYGVPAVDWQVNTRAAYDAMRGLMHGIPGLPDAAELPDTTYEAQGFEALAVGSPRFTGTVTPYSLQMAIGLGGATASSAIAALRQIVREQPEVWDPLAGLLDSYHPDLSTYPNRDGLARREGAWVQNQKWPLNVGAALIAQLNYLTEGAVWHAAMRHPVLAKGVERIYRQPRQDQPRP